MLQMGTPNEEQLEFIHTEAEAMKLLGIPGGGKTKTIIDKIMYMHHTGLITKNSEFMILTFFNSKFFESIFILSQIS